MEKLRDPRVIGAAIGMLVLIASAFFAPIGDAARALCAQIPAASQPAEPGK